MTHFKRQLLIYLFGLSDMTLLGISLYTSVLGRAGLASWSVILQAQLQVHTILAIVALFFVWKWAFSMLGLYESKRLASRLSEVSDQLKASSAATLILAALAITFNVRTITIAVILRFFLISTCCQVASHLLMRHFLHAVRRHGRNLRCVLIVGTNIRAVTFANYASRHLELGYRLIGFVDDTWTGPIPDKGIAAKTVSDIGGFTSFLRSHVVDEVIVTLPIKSFYNVVEQIVQACKEQGVIVRILSDLFRIPTATTQVDTVGGSTLVTYHGTSATGLQIVAKRIVDIILSSLLIFVSGPVMLTALLLVKRDSKGPAIFTQERIGLNKRRFRMYKFRTMVVNAEDLQASLEVHNEAQGPVFKIKNDPRITRLGKFLRKTSVDELPQLFNVLRGDMSLVGPRPLPVRDFSAFSKDWQRRRFSVRPGITCLWQVSGRSSISFDRWMQLDMQYIDEWSLGLDLKILIWTIPSVIKGKGAA